MVRARSAPVLLFVLALGAACQKEPAGQPKPLGPVWTPISGEGWSLELPGAATRELRALDGGTSTRFEVQLADGVYGVEHFTSPDMENTQNRKVFAEIIDTEIYRRLAAVQVSEQAVKVDAGLSWDARDLVLKTPRGDCKARDLFAGAHYFFLSACAVNLGGAPASWERLRDSLKLTIDPMAGVGERDSSSWAAWSPDGKARLLQRSSQSGQCLLVCERDVAEVWRAETDCRGSAKDAHFVANDCERSVLFPDAPPRGTSLLAAKVLSVYARERLAYDVVGAAVIKKTEAVQRFSHLVQGLGGNSGDKPRYAEDGQSVVFKTVESRSQTVPLSGDDVIEAAPVPREPAPAKPPRKKKVRR